MTLRPRTDAPRRNRDLRAQSETIGIVLLLGITIIGTTALVAFGSTALTRSQQSAQIQRTEHAMTLLDSRGAMTALGESPVQSVDLGDTGGGTYSITDSGWIRVTHANFTGKGDNETIYNATLGAIVYRNGNTSVAYQGGGTWRNQDGGTVMVSPPEFHYRGSTLTLPIIRVEGADQSAGRTVARIESVAKARHVFPNASATSTADGVGAPYDDAEDTPYANPVINGTINVTVHSAYYQGWAQYFRTRTEGNVTVDPANETATVELVTLDTNGAFDLGESQDVKVRGKDGDLTRFNVTFARGNPDKFYWSFWAKSGSKEFEIHIASKMACKKDDPFFVAIYYHDAAKDLTHQWYANVDPDNSSMIDITCGSDPSVNVDLLNDELMTYDSIDGSNNGHLSNDDSWYFSFTTDMNGTAKIDGATVNKGETKQMGYLVNYYMEQMGSDVTLRANSAHGDMDSSSGSIEYPQGGSRYITFLHVTENEVRVEFE